MKPKDLMHEPCIQYSTFRGHIFCSFFKIKISYFHGDIVINTTRGYLSLVINNMNGRTLVREIHGNRGIDKKQIAFFTNLFHFVHNKKRLNFEEICLKEKPIRASESYKSKQIISKVPIYNINTIYISIKLPQLHIPHN